MLASAPLMRERLAKEARYQWRDAPGYSFEFKHMQKVWMQPKTRRGAPDLERVSLRIRRCGVMQSLRDAHAPRNLDEAVGHAFHTVCFNLERGSEKWERSFRKDNFSTRH